MEKLRISDVASELGIKAKSVYYLLAQGYLTAETDSFSGLKFITRKELNRFKANRPKRGAPFENQRARKNYADS